MKSTVSPYQTSATCVRIECLNGVTVRLTAYPYDLTMSNGAVYKTDYGYEPTAFSASASFSPSAMDLEGIVAVGGVSRDTLASGVFDNARVYIFRTDFLSPVEDYEELAAGFFGKTALEDDKYRIEGMGLVDALSQAFGPVYQASCIHTPWDAGCGISPAPVTGTLTASELLSDKTESMLLAVHQAPRNRCGLAWLSVTQGVVHLAECAQDELADWIDRIHARPAWQAALGKSGPYLMGR